MDRRGFMKMMVGGLAAGAAVRTWPFRVYSFPSEIVPGTYNAITRGDGLYGVPKLTISNEELSRLMETYVRESMVALRDEIDKAIMNCYMYGDGTVAPLSHIPFSLTSNK